MKILITNDDGIMAPGIQALYEAVCELGEVEVVVPQTTQSAVSHAISVQTPMSPPGWALLERQLLRANTAACREFFGRYFDERGYLLCVERWGGDDGPDDAIENCNDWPLLHAIGAPDAILHMYRKAWEGHRCPRPHSSG